MPSGQAGFPIRFDFQPDSAGAAIQIRWTTRLVEGGRQIGITRKTRDQHGWISRAEIDIATFDGLGMRCLPRPWPGWLGTRWDMRWVWDTRPAPMT